ncbi:MAG: hypothetical protein H7X77_09100 [Anaerolineae bacterium]|nr:hypothetical protein [Anaerolineae bacterium]
MAHEITQGPRPNIKICKITESLTHADMTCEDDLGLNDGVPLYVLLDVSIMNVGLPENFLNGAKNSFFIHPNLVHMAMYTESNLLTTIGNMVAKLTQRKEKLSIYSSYDAALKHLLKLAK